MALPDGFRVGTSHYVEPLLNSVTGPAGTVRLEPKVMLVLVCLAEHAGQVVTKERLMRTVWPATFVTDDVLTRAISELRRVLGDDAREPRFIQTILKSGYRLIARVSSDAAEPQSGAPRPAAHHGTVPPDEGRRSWRKVSWAIGAGAALLIGFLAWSRAGVRTQTAPATIAVIPFEHLGDDPDRVYLTEGLTEETIALLGQIDPEHLRVIGRTSTRAYTATTKSAAEIGRDLGVDYLVEGSVRTEGSRLRVTAKLVRVRDQVQVWADSYNREPDSLLELQQELSAAIARQIRTSLSPDRLTALGERYSRNPEAYDLYLRGRHFWNQFTPHTNQRALEFYLRATQLDPGFALAWSGLADAYAASPINADAQPLEVAPLARDAAARAVKYGPNLAEAQTSLGFVRYWLDWDWPGAETVLRKAVALDPSYSVAPRIHGIVLAYLGRREEADAAMRRARILEPLFPMEYALSSHVAFVGRDYASAVQFARQATVVGPQFWIGHLQLAQAYEQLGSGESTRQALEITQRFSDANSKLISLRGYILARLGRTGEAREVLNTLEAIVRDRYVPPYAIALVYAGLGDSDAAFQWLTRAYDARDVHLIYLAVDPKWDGFRRDPRFQDLLNRCDFARTARSESSTR